MGFAERAAVLFVRPIYRTFLEKPVWWFLAKVKAFFFAEVNAQLSNGFSRISEMERRLQSIEERLHDSERRSNAQWESLEQLLLALFRQPQQPDAYREWKQEQTAAPAEVPLNGGNESNRIR